MKNIRKTAKKLIPAAVAAALLLAAVWGVLYGVLFLNADRLAPLKDELENGGVYLRYEKKSGQPYFALKCGLLLCGIVIPSGVLTDQNMEQMEILYKLSKVQHKILKEQREKEETEQLRVEGKG